MMKSKRRTNQRKPSVRKVVTDILRSRQELKRGNNTTSNTAWTVAGVVLPISQTIVQGDTVASRSGDTIRPVVLKVNLALVSALIPYLGRVIIFQDMLNVGIDPTVAQILDGGNYLSTYVPDTAQQRRFKILYDHTFTSIANTTIVTDTTKIFKELSFKLKGNIRYNGATNATASNGPGAVYMLFISDAASGAGAYYTYYTTIVYTDS